MNTIDFQAQIIIDEFLKLKNTVSDSQIDILNDWFKRLDKYEIKHTNVYYKDTFREGFVLAESADKSVPVKSYDCNLILEYVKNKLGDYDEKSIFYTAILNLINHINFINDSEERMFFHLFFKLGELRVNLIKTDEEALCYAVLLR